MVLCFLLRSYFFSSLKPFDEQNSLFTEDCICYSSKENTDANSQVLMNVRHHFHLFKMVIFLSLETNHRKPNAVKAYSGSGVS